ncbi:glycosyltransferase family 4 protein [Verrucomicrobium spinosum]|uniref:glycosyltransferase family 4 protein n=2 Tax=Verrucomicrobium spinosum TaxID=2736 RepID=UPI0004924BBE|nr:glycosyltransferase family 4 protein [Verrucomicrobium spinosum]
MPDDSSQPSVPPIDPQPAAPPARKRLAYLYSRYPYFSQTFCDTEMLALQARGWDLVVGSIYPPEDSFRHQRLDGLAAPVLYAPPPPALAALEKAARADGRWPEAMVARHEKAYGASYQPKVRARNALYFAEQFKRFGVEHVHVHFANRATHTALFLKELTGLPFSFTTHGQDFMVDLGSDALLKEMCDAAAFIVSVCDYSRDLLAQKCPEAASKMVRIYNGMEPGDFPGARPPVMNRPPGPTRLLSIGRLIEFKGFHRLIEAVGMAKQKGADLSLRIVGEGPWRDQLQGQIDSLGLNHAITLVGRRSLEEVAGEFAEAEAFALACVVDSKGASDLLPTVITEAMLNALPVISTTVAGVPEMIEHGRTGYIVAPNDVEAFAAALVRISSYPAHALAMGDSGRRLASDRFAVANTIAQLTAKFSEAGTTQPAPAAQVVNPVVWGFYDLALPDRLKWLEREQAPLSELDGRVVAAGGRADEKALQTLGKTVWDLEWLPDGIVLESEWRMRAPWRAQLEALRTDLATSVDGEVFLRAARRAVWLAVRISRSQEPPRLLYGPGGEEALTVWLASRLTGVPCAAAFEEGTRWSTQILRRMAGEAQSVSDASGKVEGSRDVIGHALESQNADAKPANGKSSNDNEKTSGRTFINWLQRIRVTPKATSDLAAQGTPPAPVPAAKTALETDSDSVSTDA